MVTSMSATPSTITPEDLAVLIAERDAMLAERDAAIVERDAARGELRVTRVERDLLKEQLKAFERRLFGAKSEVRSTEQRDLFLNEAEALAQAGAQPAQEDRDEQTDVPAHKRAKSSRKPLDPALPRHIVRHELPESERICPHDGSMLVEIGVEVSEQLDIIPQQVRVIRHERVKYACRECDQGIKVTPATPRIIPRGLFTEDALAWFVTAKYMDGLPLYRIAALLKRVGGDISRNTLAASVIRVGQAMQPVINLMRDQLLDSDIVYGDETTVQVLKEPGRAAQSKSYLWAQMSDDVRPVRLFTYAPGRGKVRCEELWAGMRAGTAFMSDGYAAYDAIAKENALEHLGCWAHARRYLVAAEDALPKAARGKQQIPTQLIHLIGKLYAVEARTKETRHRRERMRRRYSAYVLAAIRALIDESLSVTTPTGALGTALHYIVGQWHKLKRYVENGVWPIDNNACENAIRPFVISRSFCPYRAGSRDSLSLASAVWASRQG